MPQHIAPDTDSLVNRLAAKLWARFVAARAQRPPTALFALFRVPLAGLLHVPLAGLIDVLLTGMLVAPLAASAAGTATPAGSVPTVRGINHIGVTVPDLKQVVTFFTDVMGCQQAFSFGPIADDKGDLMEKLVNVNPRAVIEQIVMMRCGDGSNLELFHYSSPDQKKEQPRNSDVSGHHIAFYVDNIDKAAADLKARGVKTFMGPFKVDQGPAAGQSIMYFLTPWDMQLELITYPKGMAYEKTSKVKLWAPSKSARGHY